MRKIGIIAVLSLLVTALAAVPALAVTTTTISPENANSGTHFQVGTATCTLTGTTVTCSSYELAGVGNADAVADLAANYTATVDCRNHGGKIVPVKASVQTVPSTTGELEPKNGQAFTPGPSCLATQQALT